jgi:hypothetical protein
MSHFQLITILIGLVLFSPTHCIAVGAVSSFLLTACALATAFLMGSLLPYSKNTSHFSNLFPVLRMTIDYVLATACGTVIEDAFPKAR